MSRGIGEPFLPALVHHTPACPDEPALPAVHVDQDCPRALSKRATETGSAASGPVIAIVGPCASGKSLLAQRMLNAGYNAREVNQEHSYVPAMWQQITKPDVLIYLHVSQEIAGRRRQSEAEAAWWDAMEDRLRHARRHADLRIDTDGLSPQEVFDTAIRFLERRLT